MINLSVIIPSRNVPGWPFLELTIDNLFKKAKGSIEVIVVLDGFWPDPFVSDRENLIIVHQSVVKGMRHNINAAARMAKGKYIMKCDDHCMFGEGYDVILSENCEDDWLAVPSRYSLDGDAFLAGAGDAARKYGPIDYLYLTYPFNNDNQFGFGFHGKKWKGEFGFTGGYFDRENKLKHIPIDDIISFQGSCWFMPRQLFFDIGCMQEEGYYDHQEAQELGFKVWLSGGRCVVNKHTWYAHLHKGSQHGRGYKILKHHIIDSTIYSADLWLNNKWAGQKYPFKYLIDKFQPLEMWPEDWDDPKRWENYDYNIWHKANELPSIGGN